MNNRCGCRMAMMVSRRARLQATLRLGEVITKDKPLVSVNSKFRLEISGSKTANEWRFDVSTKTQADRRVS